MPIFSYMAPHRHERAARVVQWFYDACGWYSARSSSYTLLRGERLRSPTSFGCTAPDVTAVHFDLDVLEREHLVGKLKLLELQERLSPYRSLSDRFERRVSRALMALPSDYMQAGVAIFGTTLYITRAMLDNAWRFLWHDFLQSHQRDIAVEDLLIIELDRDALRDDFYRANALPGRLHDNSPYRSANDLLDALANLESGDVTGEYLHVLAQAGRKPFWILLSDLGLSGTSLVGEVARLKILRDVIAESGKGNIVVLVQVLSDPAHEALRATDVEMHEAIRVPKRCALASEECTLVNDHRLRDDMRTLCRWFAEEYVRKGQHKLNVDSVHNPGQTVFGYGGHGWTIVTSRNAPNNSLPILWYRDHAKAYRPPFERVESRLRENWPGRRQWQDRFTRDLTLRSKLRSSIDSLRAIE